MALLTAGFRAGSESMLQSWSGPFGEHFAQHQDVRWLDLALIDSVVRPLNLQTEALRDWHTTAVNMSSHLAMVHGDETAETVCSRPLSLILACIRQFSKPREAADATP